MKTIKSFLALLFVLLFPVVESPAQQPDPQTIYVLLQPYKCDGLHGSKNGDQLVFLENYVDGILPSPLWIDGSTTWYETNTGPIDAAHGVLYFAGIDERMTYTNLSGFPYTQKYPAPAYMKTLGKASFVAGGKWEQDFFPRSPLSYRSGDVIVSSIECGQPGNTNPAPIGGIYLWVHVSSLSNTIGGTGSILDLPPNAWLFQQKLTSKATAQPRTSVRVVVPGAPTAISAFRGRIFQDWTNGQNTITNMSVCAQSAPGSSVCAAPPVEIKINAQSGYFLSAGARIWMDWTPVTAAAGQNLLVTVDMFTAPNGSNAWSFSSTPSAIGVWNATAASYNSSTLNGAVTGPFQAFSVFDAAQYRP